MFGSQNKHQFMFISRLIYATKMQSVFSEVGDEFLNTIYKNFALW